VYGSASEVVDEDCPESDLKPQSPYATSKIKAEKYLAALSGSQGLKFVTCRFGTIYGTSIGMRFHTAVNKFSWQAVMGEPITVWRTAMNQKRPYLELGDADRALKFILKNDLFDNRVYNVLTDNVTVGHIVDILRKYLPDVAVKLVDNQIMNQLSYEVACERFEATGFRFQGKMEEGIKATLELLKNVRR
jgi:UDP-glucose 4-epimerase